MSATQIRDPVTHPVAGPAPTSIQSIPCALAVFLVLGVASAAIVFAGPVLFVFAPHSPRAVAHAVPIVHHLFGRLGLAATASGHFLEEILQLLQLRLSHFNAALERGKTLGLAARGSGCGRVCTTAAWRIGIARATAYVDMKMVLAGDIGIAAHVRLFFLELGHRVFDEAELVLPSHGFNCSVKTRL